MRYSIVRKAGLQCADFLRVKICSSITMVKLCVISITFYGV